MSNVSRVERDIHPDRLGWRPDDTPAQLTSARTLAAALDDRFRREPSAVAYYLPEAPAGRDRMTVGDLYAGAHAAGAALVDAGLGRGDRVCLCLDTSPELVTAIFGSVLAGVVPMLAEPPLTGGRRKLWTDRVRHMVEVAGPTVIVCDEDLRETAEEALGPLGVTVVCPPFGDGRLAGPVLDADPEEPVLIQFSSGTTSAAKGVMLSQHALMAACVAIGVGTPLKRGDVMGSWLPLHHDMGMVGGLLTAFVHDLSAALISPMSFATRPYRWLHLMHRYRGTSSPAPNFAYRLTAATVRESDLVGVDLSSWRSAYNGAELVDPATIREFQRVVGPCGFRAESMRPCYGMAELGLAATLCEPNKRPWVETVSRAAMIEHGTVTPPRSERDGHEMVSCGPPVLGIKLRIVDDEGLDLPDGRIGRLMVASESMMTGYVGMPERTANDLRDGWLNTGDLGFTLDGELFVTGRTKDLIIIAGRNYQPQPLEAAAATVNGVRPGGAVAIGVADAHRGTERVVLVVESRYHQDEEKVAVLRTAVEQAVAQQTGVRPGEVIVVRPRTLPRTSSGKAQRPLVGQLVAAGTLGGSAAVKAR